MRFGFALALPLILTAACRAGPSDSDATSAEPPRPFATATQSPASAAPAGEQASYTLTATGLIAVQAVEGRGTATTLNFGDAQDKVTGALEILLGKPKLSENAECGAGPMQFADFGPITASFQNGKFVGWLAEGGPGFETTDAVAPGARFADLVRDHRATMVAGSTLDGEFELTPPDGGAMGGFVGSDGRVKSLHAGVTCFFR